MKNRRVVGMSFLFILCTAVYGADWPQWRGPYRDGVWSEDRILGRFPDGGLPIRWRVEIGPGYTGPTVAAGRVFVMDRRTSPSQVGRMLSPTPEQLDQRGGMCWSHPAFADHCIVARNDKEPACADLTGP